MKILLVLLVPACAWAQNPATWTLSPSTSEVAPGGEFTAELRLKLEPPWHMYSLTTPKPGPSGGPIATTIKMDQNAAVEDSKLFAPQAQRKFDPNFGIDTETYDGGVTFLYRIKLSSSAPAGPLELTSMMRYQLCTDTQCLPPKRVTATARIQIKPGAPAVAAVIPPGLAEFTGAGPASAAPPASEPIVPAGSVATQSLGAFVLIAIGFGFAAIFTPCVFPMIPITMSFFLNREGGTRASAIAQALVFCGSIVALFTAIGLGLTAALGPFAVVQLGSNPWVNALISAVFFAFGISLLGAFEITLPSGLLTRLNAHSEQGGYPGTIFMALTFALASFACVGPFMGTLLAGSVGGDKLQPAIGMMAFSAALSSPFFVLALFPSFLSKLPRSGGWMSRVKVVLGFIVLAAMLKYLSNIDQVLQWNFLTRERFLGIWVVLFALPGLYLLGLIRMEGIKPDERLGAGRVLVATLFLGFALSLIPGMWGVRLGEIDAYIPAAAEGAAPGAATAQATWIKNDYAAAFDKARQENKPVLVSFTGYACTNCHWMKSNMFPRPEIASELSHFILLELYTDGTDQASEDNQKRQESVFKTVAIPYYAIFTPDEKVAGSFAGLTKDSKEFLVFLAKRG
ncbi:MAG: thioredoxin family protein [Bryobacterales bacterium]|nr:thioredoxin family protein [Bryobacterales bacterium]